MQINGAGRDVPVPDLLEVVLRVQQAAPERADQLPVDRIGRRHPADHQPDGVLRRDRRPDDQRPAARGAGQDSALPDGARRRRAGLQHPGRDRRAEVHGPGARGHLPRQDHEVERPGDREAEPRRQPAGQPTSPSCTARTARARRYIWVDYLAKVSPEWKTKVGVATAVNWPAGVGGKGNEGVAGLVHADARVDRLRRADLRAPEQDQLRLGAEHGRRVRAAPRSSR